VDHPGYFLGSPQEGVAIVKEIGLDNVRMLYDIYHMGIMTGNMTVFIEQNIEWIGHFHSAGIPGRHELFNGETNYPFLVDSIEKAGYKGYFGLEYFPLLPCPETLVKTMEYLSGKK
jgi:hydroxypyruvate isomerase